ncbi:MAG: nitrate/sulfonate/bicarbonate ABC transporter ATP-binding protein [Candidatus Omnitrophica bacterium CG11_big_fil_rev_8_21_14_0_20_64_10]|nr:MAG: nitrate/sulfonate/bicarbonate ABC transporter ATP-binding protein [Candidatus Omnitrophica bacterium CG11_big_fil_rev_8_21_14_0_20_64_10]
MLVELERVSKRFSHNGASTEVLREVSFSVEEGEFVCLVGPSGCGKSTLISLIAGLESPSAGRVTVAGREVRGPGPDRVVVFQESALFPWLTVRKNVEFGLKMAGISPASRQRRAAEYLRLVHLSRFADAYPHQLSGGMKQRVAIARALAMDPKILLMDEPFGALDAQTRRLLHEELMGIWQKTGKTILFVTHNVREATVLGDTVLVVSARPGTIKKGFKIKLPRPRRESDPHLIVIQQRILLSLQEEIAKVVKDEGLEHLIPKTAAVAGADRDLGSSL